MRWINYLSQSLLLVNNKWHFNLLNPISFSVFFLLTTQKYSTIVHSLRPYSSSWPGNTGLNNKKYTLYNDINHFSWSVLSYLFQYYFLKTPCLNFHSCSNKLIWSSRYTSQILQGFFISLFQSLCLELLFIPRCYIFHNQRGISILKNRI